MDYITVREAAEKWNISLRLAQKFCTEGRIPGAQNFGSTWAIPADADKPEGLRRKKKSRQPLCPPRPYRIYRLP